MQEISEMLGGKISNHDEDEVEDELHQLEQVKGAINSELRWMTSLLLTQIAEPELPDAPTAVPVHIDMDGEQKRAKALAKAALQASDPLPA